MNCMMRPEKILQVGLLFVSLAIIHVIVPFTGLHQDGIFQMRVGTQVKLSGGYQLLWLEFHCYYNFFSGLPRWQLLQSILIYIV